MENTIGRGEAGQKIDGQTEGLPRPLCCGLMCAMRFRFALLISGALVSAVSAQDTFGPDRAQLLRHARCTYAAPPLQADGKVDAPKLVAELKELHANTYRWVIHPNDDTRELKEFLPLARAGGIRVWVTVNPPSER